MNAAGAGGGAAPHAFLRTVTPAELEAARAAGALGDVAFRRGRHVVSENARCARAAALFAAGDYGAVGALMAESHASLRDDFEARAQAIPTTTHLLSENRPN